MKRKYSPISNLAALETGRVYSVKQAILQPSSNHEFTACATELYRKMAFHPDFRFTVHSASGQSQHIANYYLDIEDLA